MNQNPPPEKLSVEWGIVLGIVAFLHWLKPYPKFLIKHDFPSRRERRATTRHNKLAMRKVVKQAKQRAKREKAQ